MMATLGDGTDIVGAVIVSGSGDGICPELAGRFEERAAQILQQPQAIGRHGQATPPREARSKTAQTSVRQLVSLGSRPMTLVRRRVSPKVRSMTLECRMR